MHLLALDQSSHITGYSIFIDGKLENYGKFSFDDKDMGKRLLNIKNKIKDLITTYNIDNVVFEEIQLQANVGNNIQTFKVLAEVYGTIELLLTELNIPYSTIMASSWKSILGIKGKNRTEQKRNAQQHVLDKYKIKVTQDEADSVCIGSSYLQRKQQTETFDWS